MVLDSLEDVLDYAGINYTRLDGTTKASERGDILDHFTTEASIRVLLLSVRSGGVCALLNTVTVHLSLILVCQQGPSILLPDVLTTRGKSVNACVR